uniref:OAR domain-containing protein n=1 Tax=Mus musculus TaxID=10090 RepID=Q9D8E1_MOUSE|nr:unnamed protein product [Mus musculus]
MHAPIMATNTASLPKSSSGDVTAVGEPTVTPPPPSPTDYLPCGPPPPPTPYYLPTSSSHDGAHTGSYRTTLKSAMATYSATCANNSPAQGINMANSIANLRLKAKEYSLQRNQVPTVN